MTRLALYIARIALGLAATSLCPAQAHAETSTNAQSVPERTDAQPASEDTQLRWLYREGNRLSTAGDLPGARKLLLRALAIRRTYDIAAGLGQVELRMQLPRDAAEHLEFAIRNFPPQPSENILNLLRRDFAEAQKLVGTLLVSVNVAGADLSVDGKHVGTAPLEAPIFVEPGAHTLAAQQGNRRVARSVTAVAGGTERLRLELAEPARSEVDHRPTKPSRLEPAVLITGGALLLVGVSAGVGFAIAAGNNTDKKESLQRGVPSNACNPAGSLAARCNDLREEITAHDRNRDISTAGFALAGAALVGTAAYWFFARGEAPRQGSTTAVRLGASATDRETRLWLSGAF